MRRLSLSRWYLRSVHDQRFYWGCVQQGCKRVQRRYPENVLKIGIEICAFWTSSVQKGFYTYSPSNKSFGVVTFERILKFYMQICAFYGHFLIARSRLHLSDVTSKASLCVSRHVGLPSSSWATVPSPQQMTNLLEQPGNLFYQRSCLKPRDLGQNRSNGCEDIAIWRFLNMSAAAILDFKNFKFLTAGTTVTPNLRHRAKFHQYRSIRCWDSPIFRFLKMAAVRHFGFVVRGCSLKISRYIAALWFFKLAAAAILDFQKCKLLTDDTPERPDLRNPAKFRQDRCIRCWDMAIFRFFNMAAVRHLGFVVRVFWPPTKSF